MSGHAFAAFSRHSRDEASIMDKSIFVRRDGRVGTGAQRAAGVLVRVLSGRGCLGGPRPGSAGSWDPSAGRRHRGRTRDDGATPTG